MQRLDLPLAPVALILTAVGLVAIYSATGQDLSSEGEFRRQLQFALIGLVLFFLCAWSDYETWGRLHWLLYVVALGFLVAVDVIGHTARGSQRWLSLGPIAFQPSELAKLAVLNTLARVLSKGRGSWMLGLFVAALPMLLIFLQPDLGTALVVAAVVLVLFYAQGANPLWIVTVLVLGLVTGPLVLHDYQRERLMTFMHPERDPTGAGWNLIQSQIAVGSGEIWGKGLFQGTQNQFNFVPEHHTDFIFTVIAEELGLVGGLAVLLLYLYVLSSGLVTARVARDRYGSLLALGIVTVLGFHVVVNVGMVIGLMPVTGVPLPLLSYGGSSLWITMIMLGLLFSVRARRPKRVPLEEPEYCPLEEP